MAMVLHAVLEILRKPTVGGVVSELLVFGSPLWIALLVGLLLGWAWKPRWAASLLGDKEDSHGPGSPLQLPSLDFWKPHLPSCISHRIPGQNSRKKEVATDGDGSSSQLGSGSLAVTVTDEDLVYLWKLVESRDGGPPWHLMMDRSLPNMSYQAWRRDPEVGPSQYRSRTVFENATPDIVRDFFWDDEFRMKNKWDDMLVYHNTLVECPTTGTMVVHWIRKFPFFCSNREYIIGRRIWNSGRIYYCMTKGVPCPSLPRCKKPRRVDLYYSSWCIRPVESGKGDGQMTACEVLLFHHEDMGIPWEIAKLGIRQGMWGCVKRIEPGLRAYQIARMSSEPLSRSAYLAQVNTKISPAYLGALEANSEPSDIIEDEEKPWSRSIPKVVVLGGALALAFTLDQGLLIKALIFGVARRFTKSKKTSQVLLN